MDESTGAKTRIPTDIDDTNLAFMANHQTSNYDRNYVRIFGFGVSDFAGSEADFNAITVIADVDSAGVKSQATMTLTADFDLSYTSPIIDTATSEANAMEIGDGTNIFKIFTPPSDVPHLVAINAQGHIENIADPTNNQDVTTKNYVDKARSTHTFRAHPSSDQSISATTWTKVIQGTEDLDENSDFANSSFTAPAAGYYLFTGNVYVNNLGTAQVIECAIFKNNADIAHGGRVVRITTSPGNTAVNVSTILSLALDDVIDLRAYCTASVTIEADHTHFQSTCIKLI